MSIHEVEGYVLCGTCDGWVVREVAARTGGSCGRCAASGRAVDLRRLEIVARGMRLVVPTRRLRRQGRRRKAGDEVRVERARRHARSRLAAMMRPLYEVILADERDRLGLDPWPVEMAVRRVADDDERTLAFAALYHALDRHGIDRS